VLQPAINRRQPILPFSCSHSIVPLKAFSTPRPLTLVHHEKDINLVFCLPNTVSCHKTFQSFDGDDLTHSVCKNETPQRFQFFFFFFFCLNHPESVHHHPTRHKAALSHVHPPRVLHPSDHLNIFYFRPKDLVLAPVQERSQSRNGEYQIVPLFLSVPRTQSFRETDKHAS
jgi:hypothetical protein